ncbi:permease prefix domain 1-containing protein [Micromonospora sp. NPDC049559]|uniref:permease prefix domain 1-containing protein n=1 Tax=Micromonospora sp. NPDC049559 TaxID=3155923 RepID=UPI00342A6CBD
MPAPTTVVDDHLRALGGRLTGPGRRRSDLLREARHGLEDAVSAYLAAGLDPEAAQRRAVAEFGTPAELAPAYQAELAAGALRSLAARTSLVSLLLVAKADVMWRGAPWTGSRPSTGYLLLAAALDLVWLVIGLLGVLGYAWLVWSTRGGRTGADRPARTVGQVLTAVVALGALGGVAVYVWSMGLWSAARAWPPMLVGGGLTVLAFAWIAHAAWSCRASTRAVAAAEPAVAG